MWWLTPPGFAAEPDDWTRSAPLTAPPQALLAAARAHPTEDGDDVGVLLEEVSLEVLPGGLATTTWRTVFVVHTRAGADDWGVVAAGWSPWYEDRPVVSARVVTPDGLAHELDPAHLSEGPGPAGEVLDDDRLLRSPLPALAPGAVVEEVVTLTRHAPFFAGGEVWTLPLHRATEPDLRRLRVAWGPGVPVTWRVPAGVVAAEQREGGRRVVELEIRGSEPQPALEPDGPPDAPWDALVVSTARDWRALAQAYEPLVESALAGVDLSSLAAQARGDATARDEVVARLLAEVRRLRYVAVEFGATGITPRSPEQALRNGYGDCKDKALLLVGLLRASGIDAHVALVRTGPGLDLAPLPGLDGFDHQIVVVPGPTPLWIDPTSDHTPLGRLPIQDQGRRALVVARDTKDLVTTPIEPSSSAEWRSEWDVTLGDAGAARATETLTTTGWVGDESRFAHADAGAADLERFYGDRARSEVDGALDGGVTVDGDDPARFVVRYAVRDAGHASVDGDTLRFTWSGWDVLGELPEWLLRARAPDEDPRATPLALTPHRAVQVVVLHPPADRVVDHVPDGFSRTVGPVTWTHAVTVAPDGTVRSEMVFDTGSGRLTPAEAEQLREAVAAYGREEMHLVTFADAAITAWAAGRKAEALQLARRRTVEAPGDADRGRSYASLLLSAGFGDASRAELDRVLAAAPDDAVALRSRGFARLHDRWGRFLGAGWDRAGALADLRRATSLAPDDARAWLFLAAALEVGDDAHAYGPGADVGGAIDALTARRRLGFTDLDGGLARHLVHERRWEALDELLPSMAGEERPAQYRVAAAALRGGVDAALAVPLAREDQADRATGLTIAAAEQLLARAYPEASASLAAAAKVSADPVALAPFVALLRDAVRTDQRVLDDRDPAAVARALVVDGMIDPITAYDRYGAKALLASIAAGAVKTAVPPRAVEALGVWLPPLVVAEITADDLACTEEGDRAGGWRVRCRMGEQDVDVFLVEERGRVRVRASSELVPELGAEVARRRAKDDPHAERWSGWLDDAMKARDPRGTGTYRVLAPVSRELAVEAVLAASTTTARAAVDRLAAATPAEGAPRRAAQQAELYGRMILEDWPAAVALAGRMVAERPDETDPLDALVPAVRAGQVDDPLRLIRDLVAARPDDRDLLVRLATLEGAAGHHAEALAAWRRAVDAGLADPAFLNNAAWATLADPSARDAGLAWALRANEGTHYGRPNVLHTLACLWLDAGRPDDAHALLAKVAKGDDVSDAWDYVQARLAEAWGLPEVAALAWARIPAPSPTPHVLDVSDLAARRVTGR